MRYATKGVCARAIDFEVVDGKIASCSFLGGCMGNTEGVARLVTGRPVEEVIQTLEGVQCGYKGTSCPDQLAKALKEYVAAQ